jgi:hypothetical protein
VLMSSGFANIKATYVFIAHLFIQIEMRKLTS